MQLRFKPSSESWGVHVKTAWAVDPRIALALVARFPGALSVRTEVASLVQVCLYSQFYEPIMICWFYCEPVSCNVNCYLY
jgi:hypothetical protein